MNMPGQPASGWSWNAFSLDNPARSLSEKSARSREQIEQKRAIMLYAQGLPTLPARSRPAVAAEPARMGGRRTSGVLRERHGGSTGSVGHTRGVRGGEARAAAVRSAPDDEVIGVRVLHWGFQFAPDPEAVTGTSLLRYWRRATNRTSERSRTFARSTSGRCRDCSSRSWRWRWKW